LRSDPNNREGWQLYARTLASIGNWKGSADAYRNLIALGSVGAEDYAGYGEMLVLGGDGVVSPAAREAFANALKGDAANQIARFYLALADAQAGRGQQALDAWVKLAGETADDDMRSEIARRIEETAKLSGLPAPAMPPAPPEQAPSPASAPEQAGGTAPGPDEAQLAAAANMSESDRTTMVNGMVTQLAARLAADPNDADGWVRLGRAYAVLAEHDKAADAFEKASALRPNDVSALIQGVQALIEAQKPDAPVPQRAIALLHRAEQIDPKRPEVLWYLGLVAAQAGHADAAQDYWRRVLDALPADSPDRKMVTDAIEAVKKE
jgi:cytochrome c-type biogenesis protein CcmH